MKISVVLEPNYEDTLWCAHTVCGLNEKAAKRRYEITYCTAQQVQTKAVILVGTTPSWMQETGLQLNKNGHWVISVSCKPHDYTFWARGSVLIDHAKATAQAVDYLTHGCKAKRIALYGINPSSYADSVKSNFFPKQDIFFNHSSLNNCFIQFFERISDYDAVICANYIVAISLLNRLREKGVSVPRDLKLCAFGDSLLCEHYKPSVTTITLDHYLLGAQAVFVCSTLEKLEENVCFSLTVGCRIIPKQTTNHVQLEKTNYAFATALLPNFGEDTDFYSDEEVREIETVERILTSCDKTDLEILNGLKAKKSYAVLAEQLFSSENTIKYRIHRLKKISSCQNTKALLALLCRYL